ncbi:sigma 54-interacting transcriptional regulator, partial [Eubacteriales bacterium OttesenSCG-928-N14]|nr:sigma 54-interacting transcriptional regulator [Eubacteriales bacterium OttesenSCG-928-N14]
GKTFLASLMHQFAIDHNLTSANAPFIIFNCAQYADNPELLSSNLFGYVKGAFTGAYTNTTGVLEAADGGILFLDEVHRLNRESQEKLFTFMDQGTFRKVGETSGSHKVDVRLVMATTEDLSNHFLDTFLRRIPIQIEIPSLSERGYEEKLNFIYLFFLNESQVLNKALQLSGKVIQALLTHALSGNVGALQNVIKLICGTAFMRQRDEDTLTISLSDLPSSLLNEMAEESGDVRIREYHNIVIQPDMQLQQLADITANEPAHIMAIFDRLEQLLEEKEDKRLSDAEFEERCFVVINAFFDRLIHQQTSIRENAFMQYITNSIHDVSRYVEYSYSLRVNGNAILAISTYLYYRSNGDHIKTETFRKLYGYVQRQCKQQLHMAQSVLQLIEKKVDIQLKSEDEILFALYLKSLSIRASQSQTRALILAHGYATASSIANVCNRLINTNLFEAFDMPIESTSRDIVERVREYIINNNINESLVILVDMGSLQDIYTPLHEFFMGPVAIINNVSTQLALHVGLQLQSGVALEDLVDNLKREYQTEYKISYPETNKQRCVITCCITGAGMSEQIKNLLQSSVPDDLPLIFVSQNYQDLQKKGKKSTIFEMYDVQGIIGTVNPQVKDVPYLALEDLIAGRAEDKLFSMLGSFATPGQLMDLNNNLVARFSLERLIGNLTILDAQRLLEQVDDCIVSYQRMSGVQLSNTKKAGLYFHVSCMIERLIRQQPIEKMYDDDEDDMALNEEKEKLLPLVQRAFGALEEQYNVTIPLAEWGYIIEILTMEG